MKKSEITRGKFLEETTLSGGSVLAASVVPFYSIPSKPKLQVLGLLNDPQFIEASYLLAKTIIEKTGGISEEQLKKAFQPSTGRFPKDKELVVLKNFLMMNWHVLQKRKKMPLPISIWARRKLGVPQTPLR